MRYIIDKLSLLIYGFFEELLILPPEKIGFDHFQDITKNELQRELIAEKARKVIRKNVLTVQKVARLFGEHVADTEILLNEIAGSYERRGGK